MASRRWHLNAVTPSGLRPSSLQRLTGLHRRADSLQQEAAGAHIAGGIFQYLSQSRKEIIGFFTETSQCIHRNRDEIILMPIERGVLLPLLFLAEAGDCSRL
ncbi:hypothetical protein ACOME3_005323 [Neoechinorhynchus agilis]